MNFIDNINSKFKVQGKNTSNIKDNKYRTESFFEYDSKPTVVTYFKPIKNINHKVIGYKSIQYSSLID